MQNVNTQKPWTTQNKLRTWCSELQLKKYTNNLKERFCPYINATHWTIATYSISMVPLITHRLNEDTTQAFLSVCVVSHITCSEYYFPKSHMKTMKIWDLYIYQTALLPEWDKPLARWNSDTANTFFSCTYRIHLPGVKKGQKQCNPTNKAAVGLWDKFLP